MEAILRLDIESARNDVARAATHSKRRFTDIANRMAEIALKIGHLDQSLREVLANDAEAFRRELANLGRQLNRLESRITLLETVHRP